MDNVFRIWREGEPQKLTQLIFCDLSTPSGKSAQSSITAKGLPESSELHAVESLVEDEPQEQAFCVYDDIREKLVARGVPREQIAFIHEANTDNRKADLFAKVRAGQVRVLLGSTFKMGAGMNVQDRLIALHDLDAPWRPGDLEQRSGRIVRQGNRNPQVHIYRYVTEATFDAYLWQTLENKQKFISQMIVTILYRLEGAPEVENAKHFNLTQMAKAVLFLKEYELDDYEELSARTENSSQKVSALRGQIRDAETRMKEISRLKTQLINYSKTKKVYAEYRAKGYAKKFYAEHTDEIEAHKAAKRFYDELGVSKLPSVKELSAEYQQLADKKDGWYCELHEINDEQRELVVCKKIVNEILGEQKSFSPQRKERSKEIR